MQKRKIASNLILFLFLVFVSLAVIFSDIFQNPHKNGKEIIDQAKLFTTPNLESIKQITLKNKSGEYKFERIENNNISPWHMVSPRNISANSLFIEKLFSALMTIKVKKIFPDEKINNSNFSIDKPTSTLNLIDQNGKIVSIIFGLMNTIDNSTYLKISDRQGIFHVEAPNVSLENASIINLIESQIISINIDSLLTLKVFRGNKISASPLLDIVKKNEHWYDREGNLLSKEKINDFIQELSALKSSFILDKLSDVGKKQISNLARNAEYLISIGDDKNNSTDYNISGVVKELADVDLKNDEYFVVTLSNSSSAYVVKKEFHEIFNRKAETLKALVEKKNDKH